VGWAADRYGSKPVMLSGLYVKILLPVAWLLMPRNSPLSLPAALIISMVNGSSDIAWAIGSGRLLYVRVVPAEKRAEYMAVYYALIGLIGGLSQVLGGRVLDFTQHLTGQFLIFTIDPFFPLFVFGLILTVISVVLFNRVQADSPVSLSEFAGLFVHGNPVMGLESLFRYYRARDERQTIAMTERMGKTKSPLTVDELLEALKDPRFNVRFEAIISIARMESDPRLVDALCNIVDGTELSLSVIAAWALGRIRDERAIPSLKHGLESQYRSIQAHCARALGTMGDKSIGPMLLERLRTETDKGLCIAYSSALGNLGVEEAVPTLFEVLQKIENEGARLEVALSLARIVGHEQQFIRLLRQMRNDRGTAVSQALTLVKRHLDSDRSEAISMITECADIFAREDLEGGIVQLIKVIRFMLPELQARVCKTVLEACIVQLEDEKSMRSDYLLLTLHTLHLAVL
jgi:HEAT repeat protein